MANEEERAVPRQTVPGKWYYAGQERDDGWMQREEEKWRAYKEMIEKERAKNGIPPLSNIIPNPKLLEPKLKAALEIMEEVLWAGEAKYPEEKWRTQKVATHIEHALDHLENLVVELDIVEDHLAHAACRLLMALQLRAEKGVKK